VGESAIVAHRLRNASVVSLTEMDVLHFTSEAVRQLLGEVPSFRTALEETTRERLGSGQS
jgi:CRP-like cAMP-binding protein